MDSYEASKGSYDTALVILHDKSMGQLMDRPEDEFSPEPDEYRSA